MEQNNKNYKVRCVGYKRKERYFTIGKVYDVVNGKITNDNGFIYWDPKNYRDYNDVNNVIEYLSAWYEFEMVTDDT